LKSNSDHLSFALRDSLPLTATLYPEILSLSNDSTFSELLVSITNDLLDSNLMAVKSVVPYKQNFLNHAKRILKTIEQNEENWWSFNDWVPFIARFNDKESDDLLREFLQLKEVGAKFKALIALLKNNQAVSAVDIEKIAEDKAYRKDLYEELKKLDKLKLFPVKYATQQKIAESEIYQLASDDDDPSSTTFIGERVEMFMGKKQKFYLFKIDYSGEDESTSYLGVTGPYPLTSPEMIASSDVAGLYWHEEYDKVKLGEQFKKYLSDMEDYLKKRETSSK